MLTLLALLAFCIYLLLGWHFCQLRLAGRTLLRAPIATTLLGAGLLCHGAGLLHAIAGPTPTFGAAQALSLTAWLALAIYASGQKRLQLAGIEPPLMAFAAGFIGLALLLPAGHTPSYQANPLSQAHFFLAMLAQSLIFIAAGIAVLMRMTDSTLHHHTSKLLARTLPPLLTLERLLFATLNTGFIALTLALIAGAIMNSQQLGQWFSWNHKTVFGLLSWIIFATLLLGHHLRGWRGRFAANWALVGFACLLLGYIGTRIALEVFLHKA
ncbi:inner membrane protein YpjD [Chitinibacter sp. ZOR0017]|uniref:cytochrome C assembly family protein n=1 Tax=Chitinibacter sp. ZOR0017 TaxID=1339254 RepID=UPI00068B109A|nr:cytochrome c biogenesis protein CcsA [Chitinibacter sp. ZOR0017]